MSYRQVYINNAQKLSLKDNNLVVLNDTSENKIPLEDIAFIILEDYKTILTSRLISEISKHYISLIVCDEKYEPTTITYAYNHHFKQLEMFELQCNVNAELKALLWQKIIQAKIYNQLLVIKDNNFNNEPIELLNNYLETIEIGDVTNREGLAAKVYFRAIFGTNFIRFNDDPVNAALNYGYKILVSAFLRSLAAHGLVSYYGIHHKSRVNNFNLAYDLIEPYRPFVDEFVYQNIDKLSLPLSFNIKKELINILNKKIIIKDQKQTIQFSIDSYIRSLIKSFEKNKECLVIPRKYD